MDGTREPEVDSKLDGWFRLEAPYRLGGEPGTFKINLSGRSSDGDRFRVFGTFEVSRPGGEVGS